MFLLLTVVFVVMSSYILFMLNLKRGWLMARGKNSPEGAIIHSISIVVPVRNEEKVLPTLLRQLQHLKYADFEVILVDDGSEDSTASLAEALAVSDKRFRLLKNAGTGKKQALTTGISAAKGSIIVTTDGDCEVSPMWIQLINQHFQNPETKMVFGGVSIVGNDLFSEMQTLEFSSLIGSGISLWGLGKPVMCNGANLAFRKEVFEAVGGYVGNDHIASGDDEFLMRKILMHYPTGVSFLNDSDGNVRTHAAPDLKSFFRQRFRWAGKWKHNQPGFSKGLAVYVLMVQLAVIALLVLLVTVPDSGTRTLVISMLAMRMFMEAVMLIPVCMFLRVQWRWLPFLALQFIYPFYVVVTGLFSNLTAVTWKNRRI